jgi:hypothetical protein
MDAAEAENSRTGEQVRNNVKRLPRLRRAGVARLVSYYVNYRRKSFVCVGIFAVSL